MMKKRPVALIIMDGYGIENASDSNAVTLANKPNLDELFKKFPNTTLKASQEAVGLPEGQMGNSEVGHMNIGAGRIVYQSLTRINMSIKTNEYFNNEVLKNAVLRSKEKNSKLHVIGLCSEGGVHSHTDHIIATIKLAKENGLEKVYFHPIADGRDVAPKSILDDLEKVVSQTNVKIATVSGRYFAMDRDKNYDRTQEAYDAMTKGKGEVKSDYKKAILDSYEENITDEFLKPFVVDMDGQIESNDTIVCINFRPDRAIGISTCLSNPEGISYNPQKPYKFQPANLENIHFVSMMNYADSVKGDVIFAPITFDNLFGEVVSKNGLKQLRIAETEKYAHVTFFFDGGVDKELPGATRILVNSPDVATYDMKPEMSAYEVTDKVIEAIKSGEYDSIIFNLANCDMVGHTGDIKATIKAVEVTDECVGKVVKALEEVNGVALITSDHGNAERLLSEDGQPYTAHTTSVVPLIITDESINLNEDGILADLAPTMLEMLNIEIPKEMTAKSLIKK